MIALNKPFTPCLTKLTTYLAQVNESGWYTNFGPLHEQLTKRLEDYLGVKNLLLVSNGTLAIQVACKTLNINSAITTPFSFVATTSSLLWQGIDTAFCDIDAQSYNLCPVALDKALAQNNNYDGIVATHVYGNPCDIFAFDKLARKYKKKIVYDAAHAFGVRVAGQSVLNFGDASTLSFHATKVFHTVEGGAIVFKRREDYEKAKQLINFGLDNGVITGVGINAKLNEYQSAVGLTILDEIDNILAHRTGLFELYKSRLEGVVDMPKWCSSANYNGAYQSILLKDENQKQRVKAKLEACEIQSRDYFSPSLNQVFKSDINMPISEDIAARVLCLPLHFDMSTADAEEVCNAVLQEVGQ
jgi:dTDP-4-amino-4,6-dideoxygalactose transaminase